MRQENDTMQYDEPDRPESLEDAAYPNEPRFTLTRKERRWVALGALKSALLIGSVYLIGGAVLIWLMLFLWT